MLKVIFNTAFLLIMYSTIALAEVEKPSDGNSTFDFFRILFSLIFVLILIYFFFWILKKKNNISSSKLYNHLGGLALGQNKSVQIIEIGKKIYILGVGEDVNLLEVLENAEEKAAIKDTTDNYNSINTGFNSFNSFIKSKTIQKFSKNEPNHSNQFEQELAEKIAQMKEKRSQSVNSLLYDNERIEKSDQHE